MSSEPQLFRINPENRQSDRIQEVDFARLGLRERQDIQEWVAANPGILGDDLLIIGKEFSGFDRTNDRLDLLAVDSNGTLVIVELKRDDTGADAHWQAIKYASYLHSATTDVIVRMVAEYWNESEADAATRLLQHLDADDLNGLNNDQRIILASHRFAPEVTSAALWLNQKGLGEDLITCIRLTPYQDTQTDALYLQASTIIPVPGIDDYLVGVGPSPQPGRGSNGSNFAANLQRAYARNQGDEVTRFLRNVGRMVTEGLPPEIAPDKVSRWGGGYPDWRYYHFWYQREPWSNWGLSYRIDLYPHQQEPEGQWQAFVAFAECEDINGLLNRAVIDSEMRIESKSVSIDKGIDTLNDEFAGRIAETMRSFIERITPLVEQRANEAEV
jgi:hypothetical protein